INDIRARNAHGSRKAIQYYELAIDHCPQHIANYPQRVEIYLGAGEIKKADEIMMRLVEHNRGNYLAHLERFCFLRTQKDLEGMGKEAEIAHRLANDKPETHLAMVEVALRRRRTELARKYLQNGLEHFPENADMYIR